MRKIWYLFYLTSLVILPNQLFCQSVLYGSPLMEVYAKEDYRAAAQNWEVDVMDNGRLCFANSHGLLLFDGMKWELQRMKNTPMLRTLKCDGDSIFVGGYNTIGYFKNISGVWRYFSLLDTDIDDEIWKIEKVKEKLFFQSFSAIYSFSNGKLRKHELGSSITYSSPSDRGVLYVRDNKLWQFYDKERKLACLNNRIQEVHGMTYVDDNILIATQSDGLFVFSQSGGLKYLSGELSDLLKKVGVNKLFQIDRNTIAFATYRGGIVLADNAYNIIKVINRNNGLPNNRVHGVCYKNGLLWVATDNGIASISMNEGVQQYNGSLFGMGSSYDMVNYKGALYIGTNQGLYHLSNKDSKTGSYIVTKANAVDGQVWDVFVIDNKLYCALNNGVYELRDKKLNYFADVCGGRNFQTLNFNSNIAVQGGFRGLAIYERVNGEWNLLRKGCGLEDHIVTEIIQGYQRNIWLKTFQGEVFRVRLAADGKSVENMESIRLSSDTLQKSLSIFEIDGTPMFWGGNHIYEYTGDAFVENKNISLANLKYVSSSFGKNVLANTDSACYMYNLSTNSGVRLGRSQSRLFDKLVYNYENIVPLTDGSLGVCTDDGFAIVPHISKLGVEVQYNPIEIEKIAYVNPRNRKRDTLYGKSDNLVFPRGTRYLISVYFSSFNFDHDAAFTYSLVKDGKLMKSGELKECKLTIEDCGYGIFQLAIHEKGSNKLPVKLSFEVPAPLFISDAAILIYILVALLFCGFIVAGYRQYDLKKRRLKQQQIEREITLLQEKLEYENRLSSMEKTVEERENDLTYLAKRILKNKGALSSALELLTERADEDGMDNLRKKLNDSAEEFDPTSKEILKDWELFEHSFLKANPNFYSIMKEKHPMLTSGDLRLCVYIKAGLLSKEIAPLFHITVKSLELKRYRMRKKLGLDSKTTLTNYLSNL